MTTHPRTHRQEPSASAIGRTPSVSPRDGRTVRLLLTVEEAAEQLGIGRTLMYALVKDGAIESVHIGRLRRIPADALPRYLERLRTALPTSPSPTDDPLTRRPTTRPGRTCLRKPASGRPGCTMPDTPPRQCSWSSTSAPALDLMDWSSSSMATRYQHVTNDLRHDIADSLGGLFWGATGTKQDN